MPNTPCESGQALEKAQNGNGLLLEILGMDLGSAPRRLGFGATPAWGIRRASLGSMGPCYTSQRDKSRAELSALVAIALHALASAAHGHAVSLEVRPDGRLRSRRPATVVYRVSAYNP